MIKDVLGIRTLEEFLNYFKIQSPEELEWYQLPLLAEKRKTVEKLYKKFTDYRDLLEMANSLNRTLYRDACNYIPTIDSFQIPVAFEYSNKAKELGEQLKQASAELMPKGPVIKEMKAYYDKLINDCRRTFLNNFFNSNEQVIVVITHYLPSLEKSDKFYEDLKALIDDSESHQIPRIYSDPDTLEWIAFRPSQLSDERKEFLLKDWKVNPNFTSII